jgi:2-polyprenyl-3-methyl-5-hydroxy-6-metoxy-1,4-benzoquinol methylase
MRTAVWFKDWFNSPYYHQLYQHRDESEAEIFIDKLITHLSPPQGAEMLDVACGKGRHSIQLAQKGFTVTGIDLSEDSIIAAKEAENENLNFYVHDMRLPFWINYFDYVFNFFTSFGYFNTRREHDDAIRTVAQSLKMNGTFVLDYLNVQYSEEHLHSRSEKQINGVHYSITKWFDETHFYKKILIEDESQKEPLEYVEKVAKFTLNDFTDMLSFGGLQIQEVLGDYSFNAYDVRTSPRLIIIAKKIKS